MVEKRFFGINACGIALSLVLAVWRIPGTQSICPNFPYGHICRNIDLTAFCLQTSQMIRIRNFEKPIRPYINFDKIFERLEQAKLDKPFVHFGGYTQTLPNCKIDLIPPGCPPPEPGVTPGPPTTAATSAPGVPPPEPPPVCPPNPPACGGANEPPCPPPPECVSRSQTVCGPGCECCDPYPDTDPAVGTIFSLQDGCELKYLKSPIKKGSTVINSIKAFDTAKENPYVLNVTEISVKGTRLHNWLHITISHNGNSPFPGSDDLGKGRIKMAFIIVHDAAGFPVGDFMSEVPCEQDCHCRSQNTPTEQLCLQGTLNDNFPCMFDGKRVVTNTGMMMVIADDQAQGKGLKEIHASWKYAQSASPDSFITELHFKALLVDDFSELTMEVEDTANKNVRLSGMSERKVNKVGVFGWNPLYTILHPTEKTIGASDFYRDEVYTADDVMCHVPLSPVHYLEEPYPDSGPIIRQLKTEKDKEKEHCYRLNDVFQSNPPLENMLYCVKGGSAADANTKRSPVKCAGFGRTRVESWFHDGYGFTRDDKFDATQIYPWTLIGARTEAYAIRDGAVSPQSWTKFDTDPPVSLYWGTLPINEQNELDYKECEGRRNEEYGRAHKHAYPTELQNYEARTYGHLCSDGSGRRLYNLPGPIDNWPSTLARLWRLPAVADVSYYDDRCFCAALPSTPDPTYVAPPRVQVQGRRQHAYQMIIAWNCIVPFGIFVSRYYKETYSKVFFLQEYWWYTIHVLCMMSAAMFTFGGIYVMELKRKVPINWQDPNVSVHIIMGIVIIALFSFQSVSGFFRIRDVKKRIFNIFSHWFLGVLEYILAVACMINSGFILLASMTCAGVVALVCLLVFQVMFYASMEVHMRNIDKLLKLHPPRSYLPPPIMRVFHKDAPDSKFRMYVLIAYAALCVITSVIQLLSMESNKNGESCFIKSRDYIKSSSSENILEDVMA